MNSETLSKLPVYFGLYFDPETGKTYTSEGIDTGFTFERARWTGPFGLHFSWPWLNPITFATRDTGLKVLQFARGVVPSPVQVSLDETNKVFGPFTRTVERMIVIANAGISETFNAGLLANSIIRHGEKRAADFFLAEVRLAGLLS